MHTAQRRAETTNACGAAGEDAAQLGSYGGLTCVRFRLTSTIAVRHSLPLHPTHSSRSCISETDAPTRLATCLQLTTAWPHSIDTQAYGPVPARIAQRAPASPTVHTRTKRPQRLARHSSPHSIRRAERCCRRGNYGTRRWWTLRTIGQSYQDTWAEQCRAVAVGRRGRLHAAPLYAEGHRACASGSESRHSRHALSLRQARAAALRENFIRRENGAHDASEVFRRHVDAEWSTRDGPAHLANAGNIRSPAIMAGPRCHRAESSSGGVALGSTGVPVPEAVVGIDGSMMRSKWPTPSALVSPNPGASATGRCWRYPRALGGRSELLTLPAARSCRHYAPPPLVRLRSALRRSAT